MCKYNIYSSTTETHHQQLNPAERRIQIYKKGKNTILDQTNEPIYVWMYVLLFWVGIYN